MMPAAPTPPHAAPDPAGDRRVAARSAAGLVVLLLALLQSLGPFLHAHARAAQGGGGLHLHLVGAGQARVVADAEPAHAGALRVAAPDEGSAVFLTTEYRRDAELAPVLLAFATDILRPVPPRAEAGKGRAAPRGPAGGAQAPPGVSPYRLPPATAPPLA